MKNKSIIRDLTTIRKSLNFERSLQPLIQHFVEDLVLLGVGIFCLMDGGVFSYIVSQVCFIVLFFRSFGLMHESVHKNLSDKSILNDILGILYGAFCFLPFLNWRKIHLQHHLWAGNIDQDPTMQLVKKIPELSQVRQGVLNFFWLTWIPYIAVLQHIVFWKESLRQISKSKNKINLFLSLLPPIIVLVVIASSVWWSPFGGLLPAALSYMLLVEIVNFPHHLNLPYRENKDRLSYLEQYKVSRSCHYNKTLGRFVFMNFNYHVEHHLYPNLPWHQLPMAAEKVMAIIGSERYNFDRGHDWIKRSRQKRLSEVLKRYEDIYEEVA